MELPQFAFESKPKLPDQLAKIVLIWKVYKDYGFIENFLNTIF